MQNSPKNSPSADKSPAEQEPTAATGNAAQRKTVAKAPGIESLSQLLREVYAGAFKRTKLKRAELTVIHNSPMLDDIERKKILGLALSEDRTLDRTRRLMLLAVLADKFKARSVWSEIQEFSRDVLEGHPAFRTLKSVLKDLPEARTEDQAIRFLAFQDYASLPWPEKTVPMKKADATKCRANAIYCLLFWFRMTRKTSIESILRLLQEHLWKPAASKYKTDPEKLHVLTNTRDLAAASIACALFEDKALQASRREAAARAVKDREMEKAQKMNEELADTQAKLAASQAEVDQIQKERTEENRVYADDRAHLKNDYEQLRGRVLRRLKEESSLIDEGLHALKREPPKVHIMVDHAERVIDGLKREMDRLRRNS